jgi:hypothetical protein
VLTDAAIREAMREAGYRGAERHDIVARTREMEALFSRTVGEYGMVTSISHVAANQRT